MRRRKSRVRVWNRSLHIMYNKFDSTHRCSLCAACENYVYIFKMALFNVYNKYTTDLFKASIKQ